MPTYQDNDFWLVANADNSKKMRFDVSPVGAGTLVELAAPSAALYGSGTSLTIAVKNANNDFSFQQTFEGGIIALNSVSALVGQRSGTSTNPLLEFRTAGGAQLGVRVDYLGRIIPGGFFTTFAPSSGSTNTLGLDMTGLTAAHTWTAADADIVVAGSASALTSGRVPFVTAGGLLIDDPGATYSATTGLSIRDLNAVTYNDDVVCHEGSVVFY